MFAAARMLAMLSRMNEVPQRHPGMPGSVPTHTMVYTGALAMTLTAAFDLRRIAALGAICYLIMYIAIHWGLLRKLGSRSQPIAASWSPAIALDVVVLVAFLWIKASADPLIHGVSAAAITTVAGAEHLFMPSRTNADGRMDM